MSGLVDIAAEPAQQCACGCRRSPRIDHTHHTVEDGARGAVETAHGAGSGLWAGRAPDSLHCVVTSAPAWAVPHRRHTGEAAAGGRRRIGSERPHRPAECASTTSRAQAYIAVIREAFAEVRRVLVSSGVAWLHIPDPAPSKDNAAAGGAAGLAWRVAFALQADGWILRNAVILRGTGDVGLVGAAGTSRYETLFLLAQRRHYFFDLGKLRSFCPHEIHRACSDPSCFHRAGAAPGRAAKAASTAATVAGDQPAKNGPARHRRAPAALNPGDVWELADYTGAGPRRLRQVGVLPVEVAARCVAAGCPAGGVVGDPFGGHDGTTAQAARALGRGFVGGVVGVDAPTQPQCVGRAPGRVRAS